MTIDWQRCLYEISLCVKQSASVTLSRYGEQQFDGRLQFTFNRMLDLITDKSLMDRSMQLLLELLDKPCFELLATSDDIGKVDAKSITARLHVSILCLDGLVKKGLVYDRSRVVRFILESIAKADAIILDSVWDGLGLDMSNKPFDTSFDADGSYYDFAVAALAAWRDRARFIINKPLPIYDHREWEDSASKLDTLSMEYDAVNISVFGRFVYSQLVMDAINDMKKFVISTRRLHSIVDAIEMLDSLVDTNCMGRLHHFIESYSDSWNGEGVKEDGQVVRVSDDIAIDANEARGISIRLQAFSSCVSALVEEASIEWTDRCAAYLEGHIDKASAMLDKYTAAEVGHFGLILKCKKDHDRSDMAIASLRLWRDVLRVAVSSSAVI